MKKLTGLLSVVLVLCLVLAACGGEPKGSGSTEGGTGTEPPSGQTADAGYTFKLKGVEIAVDADLGPIVESLGKATNFFESDSCAFQGKDKVWTYGGVVISSYPDGDKDRVLSVDIRDDTVSTPEGVYIGSAEADVKSAYGEPSSSTDTAYIYLKGACRLTFILDGGKVTGITYTSKVLDA